MTTPNHSDPTTTDRLPLESSTTLASSEPAIRTEDRGSAADDDDDHDVLYDPEDDLMPPPQPVGDEPDDPRTVPDLAATG